MRKFGFLAGLLIAALVAAPAFASPIVIKFSHVVAVDTPKGQAAEYFKKLVEERSNGEIKVEVYPNSSLFDDKDVMTPLMTNAVQMAAPSFSKFTSFAPSLQLVDLPFLFNDADHLHRVLDGKVGQKILSDVGSKGLVGLAFWDNGFKQLSANKPLLTPADAAGLKFRIMSSKVLEAQFKAVDANPQVLPFSEVYSALQQGVVDACENPLSNFYTKKFYEVQSDLTLSNHGYLGYLVVTNKIFWNKLNDQQKNPYQPGDEGSHRIRQQAGLADGPGLSRQDQGLGQDHRPRADPGTAQGLERRHAPHLSQILRCHRQGPDRRGSCCRQIIASVRQEKREA